MFFCEWPRFVASVTVFEAHRPPTSVLLAAQVLQLLPSGCFNPHWSSRHPFPCFPPQEKQGWRKRNPGICLGPTTHTLRDARGQTSDVLRRDAERLPEPPRQSPGEAWKESAVWSWYETRLPVNDTSDVAISCGVELSPLMHLPRFALFIPGEPHPPLFFFFLALRWEIQYPVFKRIWLHWFHCLPLSR